MEPYGDENVGEDDLTSNEAILKSFKDISTSAGRKFVCLLCGKLFRRRDVIKNHMVHIHTASANVECPLCHKKFKNKIVMKNHLYTKICQK